MQSRQNGTWIRRCLLTGTLVTLNVLTSGTAQAQYGQTMSYYNPQTGIGYSQSAAYGRGYYSGGFSYSSPYRSYSSYNSYGGSNYWSGQSYGYPTRGYGNGGCHNRRW